MTITLVYKLKEIVSEGRPYIKASLAAATAPEYKLYEFAIQTW